jgi:hypothetical protein
MKDEIDFWVDANTFLKSVLPIDFEDQLTSYVNEKGYTVNESKLFGYMMQQSIQYYMTVVVLKTQLK